MKKSNAFVLILLFFTAVCLVPIFTFANGGDQRVIEGKYFINLSRAPFTPRVDGRTAMLISFADIKTNRLLSEDLLVRIRIAKLGGIGTEKRTFFFEREHIKVEGGVLEFPYTFSETGLHEIFIDFAFASSPKMIYQSPDFLIDVQKSERKEDMYQFFIGGVITGFLLGFLLSRKGGKIWQHL